MVTEIPRAGQGVDQLHRARILAARADDPLAQDRDLADWRDQETADVEVLRGDARD